MGFSYTVDKPQLDDIPNATKIYWKCCKTSSGSKTCLGRAISNGLNPPLKISKQHDHVPAPEIVEVLKMNKLKSRALLSNDDPRSIIRDSQLNMKPEAIGFMTKKDAFRQIINRLRNKKAGFGVNAKCLKLLEIPENLRSTYSEQKFYWDDTGNDDKNRIIIFTTQKNLELLERHQDWYCDGTFEIAPTFFKRYILIEICF